MIINDDDLKVAATLVRQALTELIEALRAQRITSKGYWYAHGDEITPELATQMASVMNALGHAESALLFRAAGDGWT